MRKGRINGGGYIIWNSSGLEQVKIDVTGRMFSDFRDLIVLRIQNGNLRFSNKNDGDFLISGRIDLGDTRLWI